MHGFYAWVLNPLLTSMLPIQTTTNITVLTVTITICGICPSSHHLYTFNRVLRWISLNIRATMINLHSGRVRIDKARIQYIMFRWV